MRAIAASLLSAMVLAAGCVTDEPAPAEDAAANATGAATAGDAFASLAGCTALNAFSFTTSAALRPFVPANWTFTARTAEDAILRTFLATCENGEVLVVSTPMAPDEASADKHENPDVVVEAYATDPFAAAAWTALGARGEVGEFTHAALPGGGEDVTVTTANGTAFTIRVGPNPAPPLGAREFRAVYAAGTTDIGWYWGDEATDSVTLLAATPQPGPASRLAGAPTVPYSAAAWADIDLEYREGLPAAEAE